MTYYGFRFVVIPTRVDQSPQEITDLIRADISKDGQGEIVDFGMVGNKAVARVRYTLPRDQAREMNSRQNDLHFSRQTYYSDLGLHAVTSQGIAVRRLLDDLVAA